MGLAVRTQILSACFRWMRSARCRVTRRSLPQVSSVELERAVVEAVSDVAEAAAVGVAPAEGGPEELHLFLVLRPQPAGTDSSSGGQQQQQQQLLKRMCQEAVRTKLNPLFKVGGCQGCVSE